MKKLMVLVVLASAAGAGWSAPASDDGDEFTVPVKQEASSYLDSFSAFSREMGL